jgi:Na+-driven multidrug efflux pump
MIMSGAVMLCLTLMCQVNSTWLVQGFSTDTQVVQIAATFLEFISWNFVPSAVIFTCSGLFQAMGNTWPAMFSTATRILTFVIPVIWVSGTQDFYIEQVWILSVAAVALQALLSYLLLQREFRHRLCFAVSGQTA